MFQDIGPSALHNEFILRKEPQETDRMVLLNGSRMLFGRAADGSFFVPAVSDIARLCPAAVQQALYLLAVDDTAYFTSPVPVPAAGNWSYERIMTLRAMTPVPFTFGAATAAHLAGWYAANRFCGCCGAAMQRLKDERALQCPVCGSLVYPRINPAVIVGITDGDRLLLTRYARPGYNRHALIAGFAEIGEALEDTVRREVYEEVGLHVKDLSYFKSQPWAFSGSLLAGFFAELDGSPEVSLNTDGRNELAQAEWFVRTDLPKEEEGFSLTWTMIGAFRKGYRPGYGPKG